MAAAKKTTPDRTPDEIRRDIIQWFYELNRKGGAPRGMRDLCKGIKEAYGYKAPIVREHLTFLLDLGYIHNEVTMTRVQTGRTTRDQPRSTYRIAAKGIEFVEGKSALSDKDRYPGINVTATGGSTVVLGDGNVVNATYRSLYEELGRMLHAVADSSELNDSAKLEASVNIETIRDQLALPDPDPTIVERAWAVASRTCTAATLADYVSRLGPLIVGLFS